VVLLVDDQPEVLTTLGTLLRQSGYSVVLIEQFEEARRYIDQTPPDALITDVRLGAINGLQLVLHMRDAKPDAPILVLSAFSDAMIQREAEKQGARYLTKPITRQDLVAALEEEWTRRG
jgi:DNA-binding response OmpR family regulator